MQHLAQEFSEPDQGQPAATGGQLFDDQTRTGAEGARQSVRVGPGVGQAREAGGRRLIRNSVLVGWERTDAIRPVPEGPYRVRSWGGGAQGRFP
jgi:hypothetical protein